MSKRSPLIIGFVLVAIGGWLLAQNLGVRLPDISSLWPALPVIFGLSSIIQYFTTGRKDSGMIFIGVAAALVGAFFFMFTLGRLRWGQMEDYWPVFVLIGGLSFSAQWIVDPSRRGLLIPAAVGLIVGLIFLPSNLGLISPTLAKRITQLWPAALIIAGVGVLLRGMFGRKSSGGSQ